MKVLIIFILCLSNSVFADLFYLFPNPMQEIKNPFPIEAATNNEKSRKQSEELIIKNSRNLEERLNKVIFGQSHAVRETANAIIRYSAGINDPNRVIASLLYCGPSGVGKTELAKQLAFELYGNFSHFIPINMSEYIDPSHVNRLIGSPPGYIGFEDGGQLTNAILDQPYSVILLDEIEKADPKVLKLFLHIFDAGFFTSSQGVFVDCRKCIFISTSNLASENIAELVTEGIAVEEIVEITKPIFMEVLSPELYNRYELLIFSPLCDAAIEQIVNKFLSELSRRVQKSKEIQIVYDPTLVNYFKRKSLDPKLGARPLKRLIEKELATIIATAILDGNYKKKDTMKCSYINGYIVIEKL